MFRTVDLVLKLVGQIRSCSSFESNFNDTKGGVKIAILTLLSIE